MTPTELAWLAGLLEGEGSFLLQRCTGGRSYPRILLKMTDEDVVARAALLMGGRAASPTGKPKPGHKQPYRTAVTGEPALALMRELRPLMGARRGRRIDELLALCERGPVTSADRLSTS